MGADFVLNDKKEDIVGSIMSITNEEGMDVLFGDVQSPFDHKERIQGLWNYWQANV